MVFERLGGVAGYALWAEQNQDKFYEHYIKLLPSEIRADVNVTTDFAGILEKARNRVSSATTQFLEEGDSGKVSAIDAEYEEVKRE